MIYCRHNEARPLNGFSVMLAEWLAIVNLKNKLLSKNRMYEENRYLAAHMRTADCSAATANPCRRDFDVWPQSGSQPRCSGVGRRRASMPEDARFVTRAGPGGIQKCFKPELQTSRIMTVQ
jgi:hypothetical protein